MEEVILTNFSNYVINNSGNNSKTVWSIKSNRWLTPTDNSDGHLRVAMTNDNGKKVKKYIHQLIAKAFITNPNNYDVVHHIDHNPKNNKVENLMWISQDKHTTIHNKGNSYWVGKHHTAECRQKMSDAMKGKNNPMFGKPRPKGSGIQPKQVYQYTMDGKLVKVWKSTMECEKLYDRCAITKCCNNKYMKEGNNKYKGYRWSYKPL